MKITPGEWKKINRGIVGFEIRGDKQTVAWVSPHLLACEANATAITALPDLLKVCQVAQCDCTARERDSGHKSGCWFPAMQTALEKAGCV